MTDAGTRARGFRGRRRRCCVLFVGVDVFPLFVVGGGFFGSARSAAAKSGSLAAALMFSVVNVICRSSVDFSSSSVIGVSATDFATDGVGSVGWRLVTKNCSWGATSVAEARAPERAVAN